jgi:ribosomal protein L11 methyltransferase
VESWALHIIFAQADDCAVAAETLAAALDDLGALGLCENVVGQVVNLSNTLDGKHAGRFEENPTLKRELQSPPREAAVRVFFPASIPSKRVLKELRHVIAVQYAEGVLPSLPRLSARAIAPVDWVAECRRGFRGVQIARGLRVVPPWRAHSRLRKRRPKATEIIILPGMAFGTGLHETTRLCLRLLRREIHGDERVADVGSGSGILSIAAVLLGARSALAIEDDPQAHDNLRENIRLNKIGRRVRLFKDDAIQYAAELERRRTLAARQVGFDLIVCNILFEKMRPLLRHFRTLARPGRSATIIISGHLWSQRGEATVALTTGGVQIRYERRMGDWGAAVGRIQGS